MKKTLQLIFIGLEWFLSSVYASEEEITLPLSADNELIMQRFVAQG